MQTAAFNLTHILHSELAALIYSLYLRVATVYTVYTASSPAREKHAWAGKGGKGF
jgi:hypothetical protein